MLKNVKAAAFKPRPFVLMGVNNLFWDECTYTANQWSQLIPGVRPPCVSVFSFDFSCTFCSGLSTSLSGCAGVYWSQLGLVSDRICAHHLYFLCLPFFVLFPVFGVWFRQMLRSGLSCLQYALPMTVSPKMALTFTTGLYRPFLAPLLLSLCWCQETLQKCFFWMLSVYIYSYKI